MNSMETQSRLFNKMTVKSGERYESKVWLMPYTKEPATMKITRVTKSAIYYRADYGLHDDGTEWLGSTSYIDNTPEAIEKWLGRAK